MDTVAVLVVLGSPSEGNRTSEIIDDNGTKTYAGFNWDLWTKVRESLGSKYNFIVSFTDQDDENYNGFVQKVADGKYDLVIGTFFRTPWRESMIDYVTPHSIDSNIILHKSHLGLFSDLKKVIGRIGLLLVYLILTGLAFGILLFIIDPNRRTILRKPNQKGGKFLMRALLTGVATVFGEMGFLSENASLSVGGTALVIIIMIVSVVLIMFAQAKITHIMIDVNDEFNRSNVKGRHFLGFKGYSSVEKMKRYKTTVTEKENLTTEQLIQEYLKNDDKYEGCILAYSHAYPYLYSGRFDNIAISNGFGNEPASWIVSKRRNELRKDLNSVIITMTKSTDLQHICHMNFDQDGPMCSL